MTHPEYQRGYRAGRKRSEDEAAEMRRGLEAEHMQRRELRVQVFCTALQETMRCGRWVKDDKRVNSSAAYADLAMDFVNDAELKGLFR